MIVIEDRNVQSMFPRAVRMLLHKIGEERSSRNGPVLVSPEPVASVFRVPEEMVLFYPTRDANPFLHLYEAMYMLCGYNNVSGLARYTKQYNEYSDDGVTLHDAYGHRWMHHFGVNQVRAAIEALRENADDRRVVLQMWDARTDLGRKGKAVPCNTEVMLQRGSRGELNMMVTNRSNDIIWGLYGSNVVTFSLLMLYVASKVRCGVGIYTHVSFNWHAYVNDQLKKLDDEPLAVPRVDPYASGDVRCLPFQDCGLDDIDEVVRAANAGVQDEFLMIRHPWARMAYRVLRAHEYWRTLEAPERFEKSLAVLEIASHLRGVDWVVAAQAWIQRRYDRWKEKQ